MSDKHAADYFTPSRGNPQVLEQGGRVYVNEAFVAQARNLFPAHSLRIPLGYRVATDMTGKGLVYFTRHDDFPTLDGYTYEVTYEPGWSQAWTKSILARVEHESVPPSEEFMKRNRLAKVEGSLEETWSKINQELDKQAAMTPSGMYGYTKGIQKMCETASRKLHRVASKIVRSASAKDKKVMEFLATHAKRAKSTPAKILVATYNDARPKLASSGFQAQAPEIMSQLQAHFLRTGGRLQVQTLNQIQTRMASAYGKNVVASCLKYMVEKDILRKSGDDVYWNPEKRMAGLKTARTYGMYGFLQKTANMGMSSCAQLREEAGIIAADLHQRKADLYEKITGFLGEHSKTGRDHSAKLLLSVYPDVNCFKRASTAAEDAGPPTTVEGWLAWEPEP